MSMISELVDRLRRQSKSMGKYGVDYMATLLMQASDTIVMLSEKARADTSQSCFNCDHYEQKGWCDLFEDTVSPNYKCCSEFTKIKPYECEIKAFHKEYQEPYCEVVDTPQTTSTPYCVDTSSGCKVDTPQTEQMKTADYCDICKQDMCKYCIADATNPYCVPSHYEINYEPKDEPTTQKETQNSNLTFETQTEQG